MDRKYRVCMITGCIATLFLALIALCLGQYTIALQDVIKVLTLQKVDLANAETVIFNIRIPRILVSLIVGSGLAAAGASFQALFSNPLATPDTLGCANGASFGAALGILLGLNALGIQISALIFGILAVVLVFVFTRYRHANQIMMIILGGMVVSSLFSALVSLIKYVADPNDVLPVITFWLMGSFSNSTVRSLYTGVPMIVLGMVVLYLMRYRMNALSLKEEEAASLGINVRQNRMIVIVASSLITASVVSMCGVVGWVGLLIPHISRMLFGNNHTKVIPGCIVFGALFMLIIDTVARCMYQAEIPVSILTAIIGAPVFLLLLRKTGGIEI
ncbi:MAG: iron ABC transporter permease [Erysipelotrichaceae bacterium]|nr:iron ABC transporter permease [Erysipelotrichaceae bacterium]MDD7059069.1 iron ABC transporter permease [Erysipelotrichaceae bacterium]MDY3659560.1 iron ABC transporter permease [Bulleidia sp.]